MNSYGLDGFIYVLAFYFMLFGCNSPICSGLLVVFSHRNHHIDLLYQLNQCLVKAGQLAAIITAFFLRYFYGQLLTLRSQVLHF